MCAVGYCFAPLPAVDLSVWLCEGLSPFSLSISSERFLALSASTTVLRDLVTRLPSPTLPIFPIIHQFYSFIIHLFGLSYYRIWGPPPAKI